MLLKFSNLLNPQALPVLLDEVESDRLTPNVVRNRREDTERVLLADGSVVSDRSLQVATQNPGFATTAQRLHQNFLLARNRRVQKSVPREVPLEVVAVLDGGAVDDEFQVW